MSYKRNPAVQCWIKHIIEGQYNEIEKFFYTIFGHVKRIRIIGTIINKREQLIEAADMDMGLEENLDSNIRLDFDLDDSTGMIRATIRNINPEIFNAFNKGDIVEIMGRISKYGEYISLWIEIMRKVDEPNLILLRNAEIVNKIKHGEIHEIPEFNDINNNIKDFSDEIDVNTLFESEGVASEHDEIKEKVYLIVEEYSARGDGINFETLKKEVGIPDHKLRNMIKDLILESRIYESDNDNFEAF
ncbi:MAG: hypothetical protein KAV01_01485 [Candidatus Lokiarchaeota archaeon]|nr:hypothetical protein [Candidatus Lokiarchaeota archaeon]